MALTYTEGAKEEKWGTNCKDPTGKVMKKVKDCIAVQNQRSCLLTCGQNELLPPLRGFRLFLLDGVDGRCEQIIGMRVELISTLWLGSLVLNAYLTYLNVLAFLRACPTWVCRGLTLLTTTDISAAR